MTVCHGFIPFFFKALLKFSPISSGIRAIGQHAYDIHYREIVLLGLVIPHDAHMAVG